jgi:hypothetical protein
MSHSSHHGYLRGALQLGALTLSLGIAGCASSPPPPAAAAAPPSQAFQQASSGVTETQGNPEDVVFVEKEQKAPQTHDNDAPATGLHHDQSAKPKY